MKTFRFYVPLIVACMVITGSLHAAAAFERKGANKVDPYSLCLNLLLGIAPGATTSTEAPVIDTTIDIDREEDLKEKSELEEFREMLRIILDDLDGLKSFFWKRVAGVLRAVLGETCHARTVTMLLKKDKNNIFSVDRLRSGITRRSQEAVFIELKQLYKALADTEFEGAEVLCDYINHTAAKMVIQRASMVFGPEAAETLKSLYIVFYNNPDCCKSLLTAEDFEMRSVFEKLHESLAATKPTTYKPTTHLEQFLKLATNVRRPAPVHDYFDCETSMSPPPDDLDRTDYRGISSTADLETETLKLSLEETIHRLTACSTDESLTESFRRCCMQVACILRGIANNSTIVEILFNKHTGAYYNGERMVAAIDCHGEELILDEMNNLYTDLMDNKTPDVQELAKWIGKMLAPKAIAKAAEFDAEAAATLSSLNEPLSCAPQFYRDIINASSKKAMRRVLKSFLNSLPH